eukprot:5706106-Pleurochrysis_carterae.AAC.1
MLVGDASRGRARRRNVRREGRHCLISRFVIGFIRDRHCARPHAVVRSPCVDQGSVSSVGREGQVRVCGIGHGQVPDVKCPEYEGFGQVPCSRQKMAV